MLLIWLMLRHLPAPLEAHRNLLLMVLWGWPEIHVTRAHLLLGVLICLDYCNTNIMEYQAAGMNSHISVGGSPRSRFWLIWYLGKFHFLVRRWYTLTVGGAGGGGGACVWELTLPSYKDTILIHESSNPWPSHLQRPYLLISSPWGLRFHHMNLKGQNIESIPVGSNSVAMLNMRLLQETWVPWTILWGARQWSLGAWRSSKFTWVFSIPSV